MSSETIPVRVGLAKKDGDTVQNGANEIFMINFSGINNRRVLVEKLKNCFHNLEKQSAMDRINVPDRCFWGPDYDAERIKISWDPVNAYSSVSWAPGISMAETEITDYNLEGSISALRRTPPSSCALSILITHTVPQDLQTLRTKFNGNDF